MSRQSRTEPYWVEPKHQPKPDAPTSFKLRPLSLPVVMDMRADLRRGNLSGETYRAALTFAIVGWKNLQIEGEPVEFSAAALEELIDFPTREFLLWADQLLSEGFARTRRSEDLEKNS